MKVSRSWKWSIFFAAGVAAGIAAALGLRLYLRLDTGAPPQLVSPVLGAALGKPTPPSTQVRISLDIPRRERLASQLNELRSSLENTQHQLDTVTEERDEVYGELTKLNDELLITYGTFEEAGENIGAFLQHLDELEEALTNDSARTAQQEQLLQEWFSFMAIADSVKELDSEPREASRYQAALLKQLASLSEFEASQVRAILDKAYRDAGDIGINYASRPGENLEDWRAQRREFYDGVYVQIHQALSAEKAVTLDEQRSFIGVEVWNGIDPFTIDMLLDYGM